MAATEHPIFVRPKDSRNAFFYAFVLLTICVPKAIILVHGGLRHGRLSAPPVYDDAFYFVDGLQRVQVFFEQGFLGFAKSLINNAPHAHYSTLAATIAFLFGGPSVVGPYIVNGIATALLAAMLFRLFRLNALTTWCVALVLVTTMWFDYAVTFFSPDYIVGFAAAIMASVLIWQSEIVRTKLDSFLTGVAAGLILFIKPSAFPMVVGLWGVAFLAGSAIAWSAGQSLQQIGIRLLVGAIPLLLIAGPYFARELPAIIDYFHLGFVREREAWSFRLSPSEHTLYYVKQAKLYFEYWFFVSTGGAVGIIALGALGGDRTTALHFSGLLLTTLAAFLVPQSLEVKSTVYGGVFYGCIAVCLILVIHFLVDRLYVPWSFQRLQRVRPAVLGQRPVQATAILVIGTVALAGLGDKQIRFDPSYKAAAKLEYDGVYDLIKEVYRTKFPGGATQPKRLITYFLYPLPVAPHAYAFRGLIDGLNIVPLLAAHETELQVLIDNAGQASLVVVPDEETLKTAIRLDLGGYPFLVKKLLPAFREWIAHDARLKLIATIPINIGSVDVYADVPVEHGSISRSPAN